MASIARPGGNITGLFLDLSELSGKHLQILKEVLPATSRVGVIGDSEINAAQLRELGRVAQSLALQTLPVELKSATNLEDPFDSAKRWGANALIVCRTHSPWLTEHASRNLRRNMPCPQYTFTERM